MYKLAAFIFAISAIFSVSALAEDYPIVISPKTVTELTKKLSDKITADQTWSSPKTVAILDFELIPEKDNQKIDKVIARDLSEDLSTSMSEIKNVKLVERGQLKKALSSARLDQSDIIDPKTAKELGKMVSADYILCGSISDRGVFAVINARMIDAQTGEVKFSVSVDFNK
ncbi:CsgG/HfaB family protein [bacterium]|nr:CsgG/HfaB family protein [bacterium]